MDNKFERGNSVILNNTDQHGIYLDVSEKIMCGKVEFYAKLSY